MSILSDIKKAVNVLPEDDEFDTDILMHLNGAASILSELGVDLGPIDSDTLWPSNIETNKLQLVKDYVYLYTKLLFDPPSGSVLTAYEKRLEEITWRIPVAVVDSEDHDGE